MAFVLCEFDLEYAGKAAMSVFLVNTDIAAFIIISFPLGKSKELLFTRFISVFTNPVNNIVLLTGLVNVKLSYD